MLTTDNDFEIDELSLARMVGFLDVGCDPWGVAA
jgi:hypothetical protein